MSFEINTFRNGKTMLFEKVISLIQSRMANMNFPTSRFHKSATVLLDQRWRMGNRLTKNTNAFGPLTNMSDYSFKDGRPTPFGIKQIIRINKQREYFMTIKKLTREIDCAVDRHRKLEEESAAEKQRIIGSKLKVKGFLL